MPRFLCSGPGSGTEHATRFGVGVYRFEDLRVWQAAKLLCDRVGELMRRAEFRNDPELCQQMSAASLSVMNNISQGFLRRRDKELMQHLRYAAASNGELRSCFYAADGRNYLGSQEAQQLIADSNVIGRMIRRFQATLEPLQGQGRDIKKGTCRTDS